MPNDDINRLNNKARKLIIRLNQDLSHKINNVIRER